MEKSARILVVDDETSIREFFEILLEREGFQVRTVDSAAGAIAALQEQTADLVITDIAMPGMSGIELMGRLKQSHPDLAVIVITAHGSAESAVEAMKLGAADYLTKPFQVEEMKLAIRAVLKAAALEKENQQLRAELGKTFAVGNIVGNAPAMKAVFDLVERVSATKTNIMVLGESGTGKELVAHAIHRNGSAPSSPFVVINCAAVPEALFESELFGHRKGSFTGATADKKGIFEQADGGTLFLDEVGDIPLAVQVKILRAIQQKSFRPLGALADTTVDVRLICATNKDLEDMVAKGTFREDLFYRLNVIQVRMPSLRERREDIPLLAEYFLRKFSVAMGKPLKGFSKEALRVLSAYSFPGNVRELENVVERAVALENTSIVLPETLPQKLVLAAATAGDLGAAAVLETSPGSSPRPLPPSASKPGAFDLEKGVEEFERAHILSALTTTKGVKKRAAALLGISFRSLRYRIEKYGIADPNPEEKE